jgi:protein-S-isoprenylcysteine O-methyltransferase Ste14
MSPSSPATQAERPFSRLLAAGAEFLIRRRILISAVLFALLVGYSVAYGAKPHDLANFRDPWSVAGTLLVVCGLALRSWAAGILRKNAELTTAGPYAVIRNPLYAGSFLMVFGFCALVAGPITFVVILVPLVVIYSVKVRQEERLLATRFADQWPAYAAATPRFVPRPRRVDVSSAWSVSQWLKHREYQAVLASLLALVLIQFWHWL